MHLEKKLCIKKRSLVRGRGDVMREVAWVFSRVFLGVLALDNALSAVLAIATHHLSAPLHSENYSISMEMHIFYCFMVNGNAFKAIS